MRPLVIVAVVIGIAAIAGGFFLSGSFRKRAALPAAVASPPPWLEVITPTVSELAPDSASGRALRSGSELQTGMTLAADVKGSATIHFADGSVARIDPGTTLTIDAAAYDERGGTLRVGLRLAAGRVWSKVLALATPASLWEVRTANAVATVRGTAFGIAFAAGRTRAAGSEERITVTVVDPQTGTPIAGTEVTLSPDDYAEVSDAEVAAAAPPELRTIREAPPDIQQWISDNRAADRALDELIERLEATVRTPEELREAIRKEQRRGLEAIEESKQEVPLGEPEPPAAETPPGETVEPAPQPLQAIAKPERLGVETARGSLTGIVEENTVAFTATLAFDDGTRRDVTNEVAWRVLGPIGSITKQGVFTARLDPNVAELGRSSGSVTAVWKDPASGKTLLGATPIFSVEAKVEGIAPQG